jgi:hypothetical protein
MLKILRYIGIGTLFLLGICAALSLCYVLLNNVMLLWAGLALCSLAFSILLLWLSFSGRSYQF